MADFFPGVSPASGSSYIPFSNLSKEDARLVAEDPGKTFADLLRASAGGAMPPAESPLEVATEKPVAARKPVAMENSPAGAARKTLIDKKGADFDPKLYEQCQELETFLVKTLLTSMRNTVQKSGLVDQGFAGEMYEDILYDEYAQGFTKNSGFGLADLAYLELTGQRGKAITRYA